MRITIKQFQDHWAFDCERYEVNLHIKGKECKTIAHIHRHKDAWAIRIKYDTGDGNWEWRRLKGRWCTLGGAKAVFNKENRDKVFKHIPKHFFE